MMHVVSVVKTFAEDLGALREEVRSGKHRGSQSEQREGEPKESTAMSFGNISVQSAQRIPTLSEQPVLAQPKDDRASGAPMEKWTTVIGRKAKKKRKKAQEAQAEKGIP